jgi:hypothetical protein
MTIELEEIGPGRWRVKKASQKIARSDLPLPYVISDIMDPVEQVDGRFYTSKRAFRAVGKANGLIEVGTSKLEPKRRATDSPEHKRKIRDTLGKVVSEYKQGRRPKI